MTQKLINTIGSMLFMSFIGICIVITSAFIKLPVAFEQARYISLFVGVICLGCAWYDYRNARKQAELIDKDNATLHDFADNHAIAIEKLNDDNAILHDYADDHAIRIDRINSRLKNDKWFRDRVDVAYFRRDKYGNRFMLGNFYCAGEITSWGLDAMTIDAIREVVGRESIKVGDGTVELDKKNRWFKIDNKCEV